MDSTKDKNKKGKKKRDQELAFVDVAKTRTSLANWTGRTLGRRISIARTTSAASTMNVRATTRHDSGRNVTGMRMDGMNGGGDVAEREISPPDKMPPFGKATSSGSKNSAEMGV